MAHRVTKAESPAAWPPIRGGSTTVRDRGLSTRPLAPTSRRQADCAPDHADDIKHRRRTICVGGSVRSRSELGSTGRYEGRWLPAVHLDQVRDIALALSGRAVVEDLLTVSLATPSTQYPLPAPATPTPIEDPLTARSGLVATDPAFGSRRRRRAGRFEPLRQLEGSSSPRRMQNSLPSGSASTTHPDPSERRRS